MAALGSKLRPGVGPSSAWKDAAAENRLPWKGGSIALVVADSAGWCLSPPTDSSVPVLVRAPCSLQREG